MVERYCNLLKCFLLHKDIRIVFFVEILVGTTNYSRNIDFVTRRECVFQYSAVCEALETGTYKCRTFSRLHMLKTYYSINIIIEIDTESVFQICCCCHLDYCIIFVYVFVQATKIYIFSEYLNVLRFFCITKYIFVALDSKSTYQNIVHLTKSASPIVDKFAKSLFLLFSHIGFFVDFDE